MTDSNAAICCFDCDEMYFIRVALSIYKFADCRPEKSPPQPQQKNLIYIADTCLKAYTASLQNSPKSMASFYDEVEIEDMTFDEDKQLFHFPCPCGDRFEITIAQLKEGDEVARCPSCSLIILVIYDQDEYLEEEQDVAASLNTLSSGITA